MDRGLYSADHEVYRQAIKTLVQREVVANLGRWEQERLSGRDVWTKAGAHGIVGLSGPTGNGGAGLSDYRYRNLATEELAAAGSHLPGVELRAPGRHPDPVRGVAGQRRPALTFFQNTRFALAEVAMELDVTGAYVDKAVPAQGAGTLPAVEAAKATVWASETRTRVVDRLLHLYGGYGYMAGYPIVRAYLDARVQGICGGTKEIMKEIIGRDIVGRR